MSVTQTPISTHGAGALRVRGAFGPRVTLRNAPKPIWALCAVTLVTLRNAQGAAISQERIGGLKIPYLTHARPEIFSFRFHQSPQE